MQKFEYDVTRNVQRYIIRKIRFVCAVNDKYTYTVTIKIPDDSELTG